MIESNNNRNSVLVVEDSDVDFDILENVIARHPLRQNLERQQSGEKALAYLRELAGKGFSLPSVVLMDLNLIGISGIETVRRIRGDERLRSLPLVIISTSSSQSDVNESYAAGANGYLSKPLDFREFESVISKFIEYWFSASKIPSSGRAPILS